MNLDTVPASWLALGFLGQACFSCRFMVQWIASEKRKTSVVPTVFWWFSLAGGLCLLGYALLRKDVVIVAGQAAGLVVYSRNLLLLRRRSTAGQWPGRETGH
jgi:lipid-A-disaccharide synthase-like uncharacterized protein